MATKRSAAKKRSSSKRGAKKGASSKSAGKAPAAAAKKPRKLPPGEYAFESGKTTLGNTSEPGFEMHESPGRAEFTFKGKPYASIERDDDEVIVSFLMPETHVGEPARNSGYSEDPRRAGWYLIRLGKPESPWLEAEVGDRVGETIYALKTGKVKLSAPRAGSGGGPTRPPPRRSVDAPVKSISSAGGPYVVAPKSQAKHWTGSGGGDYESAQRSPDTAMLLKRRWGRALVLGTPDPLSFHPRKDGGIFARVVSFDADDNALLERLVAEADDAIFSATEGVLQIDEDEVWAFDAALAGDNLGKGEYLACALPRGKYKIADGTLEGDGVELILVRLSRV